MWCKITAQRTLHVNTHNSMSQSCLNQLVSTVDIDCVHCEAETAFIYMIIFIYKTVLKPVWTYGIELRGCATKSNIAVIQRYQSKHLRSITNAPWYVSNHTLHFDLHIPTFARFSGNGLLPTARPWFRTPTLSWNH
jgi:hypothetical protein